MPTPSQELLGFEPGQSSPGAPAWLLAVLTTSKPRGCVASRSVPRDERDGRSSSPSGAPACTFGSSSPRSQSGPSEAPERRRSASRSQLAHGVERSPRRRRAGGSPRGSRCRSSSSPTCADPTRSRALRAPNRVEGLRRARRLRLREQAVEREVVLRLHARPRPSPSRLGSSAPRVELLDDVLYMPCIRKAEPISPVAVGVVGLRWRGSCWKSDRASAWRTCPGVPGRRRRRAWPPRQATGDEREHREGPIRFDLRSAERRVLGPSSFALARREGAEKPPMVACERGGRASTRARPPTIVCAYRNQLGAARVFRGRRASGRS